MPLYRVTVTLDLYVVAKDERVALHDAPTYVSDDMGEPECEAQLITEAKQVPASHLETIAHGQTRPGELTLRQLLTTETK